MNIGFFTQVHWAGVQPFIYLHSANARAGFPIDDRPVDGDQEVPAITTDGTGTAVVTFDGTNVSYRLTVTGMTEPLSAAHFHNGAAGVAGSVVRGITDDFTGNTAVGTWKPDDSSPLTAELIQELLAGNLYLNVHSAASPSGEIRGQRTASHFHNAAEGTNGGVVRDIGDSYDGNSAAGTWAASDSSPLTDTLLGELMMGNLYLNVHTAANPSGEIRGQIGKPARDLSGLVLSFARSISGS